MADNGGAESGNLIVNGGFEQIDIQNKSVVGWEPDGGPALRQFKPDVGDIKGLGPIPATASACRLTEKSPHGGKYCAMIKRTGDDADHFIWAQNGLSLQPGRIYRLRFWAKADEHAMEMAAVCISANGAEGPAWPLKPIYFDRPDAWQEVEMLFRAQVGFNPIDKADLQFRLYQWAPDNPDDKTPQHLWLDDVTLDPMPEGEPAAARIVRWLIVPTRKDLRYADVELSLGDGVMAEDSSVELYRDGVKLSRVADIDQIAKPGQYAFSGRMKRAYVREKDADGKYELRFKPLVNPDGGACLNMPAPSVGKALAAGAKDVQRIPLEISEPGGVDRANWPVTQGLPLPRGLAADASEIRVLDPNGKEIAAQVRATSFWEDDSVRWALLDFTVDVKAGQKETYTVECGAAVRRGVVDRPLQVSQDDKTITVDTGAMKFTVSKERFRLVEDVEVGGIKALSGSPKVQVVEDTGKVFTTDGAKPYLAMVEESGPLHAVIAVLGWNVNDKGEKLCTYTTRIHAYRGQRFVRVFHTLTNRHEDNVMGKHKVGINGWPKDESGYKTIEVLQRNIADASILLPLAGADKYEIATNDGKGLSGAIGSEPIVHRQGQRATGELKVGATSQPTDGLPGSVTVRGAKVALTAAVYNYANLFPKELRLSQAGVELGLIPFGKSEPHGLFKGTARTTEMLLAFSPADSREGPALARSFAQPVVFANPTWYCASKGFMNDTLIPADDKTVGTYDRIIENCVNDLKAPLGPGQDDCGLMNYGDFLYGAYNRWVNLEYDSDLGLYMHFARTGQRFAYLFGQDCSRHFMDSDTGWYTGNFLSHGANFPHDYLHYNPHSSSGHTYTVGLMHYYLLTGDRRGLEATRYNADACYRLFYFSVKVKGSTYRSDDVVAIPRRQHVNDRHRSDPARYPLHTYQVTGEPRFLESTLATAEQLVKMNKGWLGHDDGYLHYRWPLVLEDLAQITGRDDLKQLLIDCAEWTMKVPYARYGEYRAAQCYSGYPSTGNNTRMMFQTIYAYELTGDRRYLDWILNMYDEEVEGYRKGPIKNMGGKGFGKFGDNPARALEWIVPNRTVLVDVAPARFELTPPGKGDWKINLGNTSATPVEGMLEVGPLPAGVKMETKKAFKLELKEEKELAFPIEFTDALAEGRTTIPYSVFTTGTDGRKGERHGFFAIHALRPAKPEPAKLLFHAPLDDASPAMSLAGSGKSLLEKAEFIEGKVGKALGPKATAMSFDLAGNIRAEAGTLTLWVRLPDLKKNLEILKVWGHGNWFLGFRGKDFTFAGINYRCDPFAPTVDRWHHVAITWDLQKVIFYFDGKAVRLTRGESRDYSAKYDSQPWAPRNRFEIPVGKLQLFTQESIAFDDLRIHSQPLSAEEIAAICKDLKFGRPADGKVGKESGPGGEEEGDD